MKKLIIAIGSLTVMTLIFGTIYAATQQTLRQSANDPQIQMAQDIATELNSGKGPEAFVSGKVDMKSSLAPFVIIYNRRGEVVVGSGFLDGKNPVVPIGVLQHATASKYNAVTWEPKKGVRIASVETVAKDYYVLSGRNLREVENREDLVTKIVFAGWFVSIVTIWGALLLKHLSSPIKTRRKK